MRFEGICLGAASGEVLSVRGTSEREFMPEVLIAAIARMGAGAVAETILAQCDDLETSRLTLFTAGNVPDVSARLRTHLIPRRSAVASGSGGTGVPGMGTKLTLNSYFADTAPVDYLRNIGIFPDAAHYYNIAIDEGRCVIAYNTSVEEAPIIEERFRACGFVKVRRFPLASAFAGDVC